MEVKMSKLFCMLTLSLRIPTETDSSLPAYLKNQEQQSCNWVSQEARWPIGKHWSQRRRKFESLLKRGCYFLGVGIGKSKVGFSYLKKSLTHVYNTFWFYPPNSLSPQSHLSLTFMSSFLSWNNPLSPIHAPHMHTRGSGHPNDRLAYLQRK